MTRMNDESQFTADLVPSLALQEKVFQKCSKCPLRVPLVKSACTV